MKAFSFSLKLLTCYVPSRSKVLFFEPDPKGGKIADFQMPAVAIATTDKLSNPDPGPFQRKSRESLVVDLILVPDSGVRSCYQTLVSEAGTRFRYQNLLPDYE